MASVIPQRPVPATRLKIAACARQIGFKTPLSTAWWFLQMQRLLAASVRDEDVVEVMATVTFDSGARLVSDLGAETLETPRTSTPVDALMTALRMVTRAVLDEYRADELRARLVEEQGNG